MADPAGDVERLRAVLDLCAEKRLTVARVRVGGIELAVTPSPRPPASDGTRPASTEDRVEDAKREFLETMYASSVGEVPDFGDS